MWLAARLRWKRRLASTELLPLKASPFVPVSVRPDLKPQLSVAVEPVTIELGNGGRVVLPVAAGIELICQVVETVVRMTGIAEDVSC